jgi:hypothetical protein
MQMRLHVLAVLLLFSFSAAQDFHLDEKQFFTDLENSYFSMSGTELQNFTCLVTNSSMEDFAEKKWENDEIFPLQFIWIRPDRIFLSQQGVPALNDSLQKEFESLFSDLKQQVKAILLDLQRFYINGIYSSISQDYILVKKKQVIDILFDVTQDSLNTQFKYTFGMNGLCLKIETGYPQINRTIITYPKFRVVKTKWLCTGWEVQIIDNGEVSSGFAVTLKNQFVDPVWVPVQVDLQVQKKEEAGKRYADILKFKNYLFNQSLQLIDEANTDR